MQAGTYTPTRASWQAMFVNPVIRYAMKRPLQGGGGAVRPGFLRAVAKRVEENGKRNYQLPVFVKKTSVAIGNMTAEWLDAGNVDQTKAVLYLHGGGYFMCSAEFHRPITWRVSRAANRRVLAINYRMAPDHAFPAWIDDAEKAYRYLLEQGFAPENITVGGDSAGGNLALVLLLRLREKGLPMPACAFVLSPWTDFACKSHSLLQNDQSCAMFTNEGIRNMAHFLVGNNSATDPMLSPVYADFSGFPPLLVHACDTEVLRDDSRRLVDRARHFGVSVDYKEWVGVPHVFHLLAGVLPEAKIGLRKIGEFVLKHA